MNTVNKVILVGNLGHDPELRTTKNGKPFCRVNIATHERASPESGEEASKTTWHMVHVFGKQAEWTCRSLRKGARVFVEAKIEKLTEEDSEGKKETQHFLKAYIFTGFGPMLPASTTELAPGQGGNFIVPNA